MVGNFFDFVQLVADKNERNTFLRHLLHAVNKLFCFNFRQHGRRLVQHDQPGVAFIQFPRNFNKLLVPYGKVLYNGIFINAKIKASQHSACIRMHGFSINAVQPFAKNFA